MSLELSAVSHRYAKNVPRILDQLDLEVTSGSVIGLVGPSGAGKSTLLAIASLMLAPTEGKLRIDGQAVPARGHVPAELRQRIGILPQNPRSFANPRLTLGAIMAEPLALRDGLAVPRPGRYRRELEELAREASLEPALLERKPWQVSDGQLQRALLGRALALDPALLVCDEPTSALDPGTTAQIFTVLRERARAGAAVLIASHDNASLAEHCDSIHQLSALRRPDQGALLGLPAQMPSDDVERT
ncbi:ABC transporter ATP-binding protein [Glutamicibacter sp.]|uniref:ABC transporter ATP-binding protein n=1 Tax=Glutamicibacter sp. TaxID=1931995 RepID=UPI003D6B2C59